LEQPEAEKRRAAAGPSEGKGKKKTGSGNFPEPLGQTRDLVGSAVGMSGKTLEKARARAGLLKSPTVTLEEVSPLQFRALSLHRRTDSENGDNRIVGAYTRVQERTGCPRTRRKQVGG
jgi:hypothetical protein